MRYIDVFNGDADGICALVQMRLASPQKSELVTGIKRDINLLDRVEAQPGDQVTVLDISMQKNQSDLARILTAGAQVFYADHHQSGEIPQHPNLEAHIDLSAKKCTSLIVDKYLNQQFHLWAITATFGDNMTVVANGLAKAAGLSEAQTKALSDLGLYMNYNGYGSAIEDLLFHPAKLYEECVQFSTPFEFMDEDKVVFEQLAEGYQADMAKGLAIKPVYASDLVAVVELPDEKWAHRVSGVLGNALANQHPERAHAIVTAIDSDNYLVSLRAPDINRTGADKVASQFETGGGRQGAAGINVLPVSKLSDLIKAMEKQYA